MNPSELATPGKPGLHVVLFEPEIAQNAGSVGRTCVAVGAKLWLVRPLGFTIDDRLLRRAGLDYWQHLQWETVANWEALTAAVPASRWWWFSKKGRRSYTDVAYAPGDALVFGSESRGLPEQMLQEAGDRCLRIPTRPEVRSLNLSSSRRRLGAYQRSAVVSRSCRICRAPTLNSKAESE